jgi:cytosine/adenosine deaminase-related metal-dependent hydrolase
VLEKGSFEDLNRKYPDAEVVDLGDTIAIHGLTNAHTHLELSGATCGEPPASFVDWILSMPRRVGREVHQPAHDKFAAATRTGIEQCLRFGVTCVGDISQQMHVTRPILRDSPLHAISYGEVIGLGKRRARFEELLPLATDQQHATDRLTIGLSPHSPYTLEPQAIGRCVALARQYSYPMTIHLAETPGEEAFLSGHSGPLKEMWERLGSWEDFPGTFDGTPVEFAKSIGLLDYPTELAHVNYCSDPDMAILADGFSTVIYCPRTHKYFGHPPHRWREMIERGINVCVGTDSCASSPDLNIVDELRLMHEIAPDWPVAKLWKMATVNAWKRNQNRAAAFTVFAVSTDDPLGEILEDRSRLPREVWIDGLRFTNTRPASPC